MRLAVLCLLLCVLAVSLAQRRRGGRGSGRGGRWESIHQRGVRHYGGKGRNGIRSFMGRRKCNLYYPAFKRPRHRPRPRRCKDEPEPNGDGMMCQASGDPHYITFDGLNLDPVGGRGFQLWDGTQLLIGTCGKEERNPFKLWATTKTRGILHDFELEFEKDCRRRKPKCRRPRGHCRGRRCRRRPRRQPYHPVRFHITVVSAQFASCSIQRKTGPRRKRFNFKSTNLDACAKKAARFQVEITQEGAIGVRSMVCYEDDMAEFEFVARHGYFRMLMDKGLYGNRITGLCGNANDDNSDDGNCFRSVGNLINCFDRNALDGTKAKHYLKKFKWPKKCPARGTKARGEEIEVVMTPKEEKRAEEAEDFCSVLTDEEGPFAECLEEEDLAGLATACETDYTFAGEAAACGIVTSAVDRCFGAHDVEVDLSDTQCGEEE